MPRHSSTLSCCIRRSFRCACSLSPSIYRCIFHVFRIHRSRFRFFVFLLLLMTIEGTFVLRFRETCAFVFMSHVRIVILGRLAGGAGIVSIVKIIVGIVSEGLFFYFMMDFVFFFFFIVLRDAMVRCWPGGGTLCVASLSPHGLKREGCVCVCVECYFTCQHD